MYTTPFAISVYVVNYMTLLWYGVALSPGFS